MLAPLTEMPSTLSIPGRLVRKHQPGQVFVTSWHPLSDTTHTVTAHWPEDPGFYTLGERYSPLLLTETVRQALALLSHTAFDVPLEYRLGWDFFSCTVNPVHLGLGQDGADVELTVTHAVPVRRRPTAPVRLEAQITVLRGGELLGAAHLRYTCHPPALYNRLRGRHADAKRVTADAPPPPPPVPPASVGRLTEADVALSPTEVPGRWLLRADTGHPVLFDHAHDHVPGMVLLEAAVQAAWSLVSPRTMTPVTFRTRFTRYTELDAPCWIDATPVAWPQPDIATTDVTGVQHDQPTFTTHLVMRG